MSLMTDSTDYMQLTDKYRNFAAPTVKISVEGTDLAEQYQASIGNVSVELGTGYAASGCSFDVTGEYVPADSDFNRSKTATLLELGAKVELSLGYVSVEKVFAGLITGVTYVFDTADAPYIHVECMDAKALLMKVQSLEIVGKETVKNAVSALINQSAMKYLSSVKIDDLNDEERQLPDGMESDYHFIVRLAQYFGCEFFIVAGEAYFRSKSSASTASVITLGPDKGLFSARLSLSGAELVKAVTVVGIDPKTAKELSAKSTSTGTFGDNSSPAGMLSGTERIYYDARANTQKETDNRAKSLLSGIESRFGRLEAECVGLPEIVPGRMITIEGLSKRADRLYYVTDVRHRFNDEGFLTTFEARINTL